MGCSSLRDQIRSNQGGADPVRRINLALALANQSNSLADHGQREDALAAIDEAVHIHREPAQARPDAFEHGLAGALIARSSRLAQLGRGDDALAAITEAVGIRRRDLGRSEQEITNELGSLLG
jgi:Anaphase-promoting complex subunit 5